MPGKFLADFSKPNWTNTRIKRFGSTDNAKSSTAEHHQESEPSQGRGLLRRIIAGILVALSLILAISLLTHHPYDYTSMYYPVKVRHNLLGSAGAWVAHYLFYWSGLVAYLAILLPACLAIWLLLGYPRHDPAAKFIILLLLMGVVATVCSLTDPAGFQSALYPSRGGIYGLYFAGLIKHHLGIVPGVFCLAVITLLLCLLACENDKPAPVVPTRPSRRLSTTHSAPAARGKQLPPPELLEQTPPPAAPPDYSEERKALEKLLHSNGIPAQIISLQPRSFNIFVELEEAAAEYNQRLGTLCDEIAIALRAQQARVVLLPNKTSIGLEITRIQPEKVRFGDLLRQMPALSVNELSLLIGQQENGAPLSLPLHKTGSVLFTAVTNAEIAALLKTIVCGLIFTKSPRDLQLTVIDIGLKSFGAFQKLPHLQLPVITEVKSAHKILDASSNLLRERLKGQKRVDIPANVLLITELADLMERKAQKVVEYISFLAQRGKARGLYILIVTQRPSADIIPRRLQIAVSTRLSWRLSSKMDSKWILNQQGAERLLGLGDFLVYYAAQNLLQKGQLAYISDEELQRVLDYICQPQSSRPVQGALR